MKKSCNDIKTINYSFSQRNIFSFALTLLFSTVLFSNTHLYASDEYTPFQSQQGVNNPAYEQESGRQPFSESDDIWSEFNSGNQIKQFAKPKDWVEGETALGVEYTPVSGKEVLLFSIFAGLYALFLIYRKHKKKKIQGNKEKPLPHKTRVKHRFHTQKST